MLLRSCTEQNSCATLAASIGFRLYGLATSGSTNTQHATPTFVGEFDVLNDFGLAHATITCTKRNILTFDSGLESEMRRAAGGRLLGALLSSLLGET